MVGFHGSIKGIAGAQVADIMLIETERENLWESKNCYAIKVANTACRKAFC